MPLRGRTASAAVTAALALLTCVGLAAAQFDRPSPPQFSSTTRVGISLAVHLLVGGLLVKFDSLYVADVVDDVRTNPVENGLVGVATLVVFIGSVVVLTVTGIGILLAIPLGLVFVVMGVVGETLAMITVGMALVDPVTDASLWTGVVVGAAIATVLTLVPLVGNFVAFLVGSVGVGAVCLRLYRAL